MTNVMTYFVTMLLTECFKSIHWLEGLCWRLHSLKINETQPGTMIDIHSNCCVPGPGQAALKLGNKSHFWGNHLIHGNTLGLFSNIQNRSNITHVCMRMPRPFVHVPKMHALHLCFLALTSLLNKKPLVAIVLLGIIAMNEPKLLINSGKSHWH